MLINSFQTAILFVNMKGIAAMIASGRKLTVSTWNVAAINNNPFEYWITYNEPYENLMTPGDRDVPVQDVFNEDMFSKLDGRMQQLDGKASDHRKIVSGFMKDKLLGSKRLASMPDRITNTINVVGSDEPVCRPTIINMYDKDYLASTSGGLHGKNKEGMEQKAPYEMLQPIKKSKYPDITEDEEKVSLPLQTMCGAIFDAILVHIMNTVTSPDEWQGIKSNIVENLNKKKVPRTLEILESSIYIGSDIITLQEVSGSFIDQAKSRPSLDQAFHIIGPENMDSVRDQNSVIFLRKETFPDGASAEITSLVESSFEQGVTVPVAKGDILAITTTDRDGVPFVVASFHGDTNAKPGKQQDVMDFGKHYVSHGLSSCWGDVPDPQNYTTYNSRTYLQPQLNKACKKSDKRSNGDVNPKDFILFGKDDFEVDSLWKDNTGDKVYLEDTAFPTLSFPSDHGILATVLVAKSSATGDEL
ncbi:hypothetical protein QTG54_008646 [Skeletonema marinoi]|uniref:Endonuclease/exonuclease/phosphatase domain-containing protein n=1 Tax=Skeletonema marinoi TaxID=267567 RepID=A0AAD8Y869_9STRA|nr:hypothetical protein QTG54_008646 [Skeletonema marinoi]